MSAPQVVAMLRVFDLPGDGDGVERHYVAEAVGGASLPPGIYQLYPETALTKAYAEGRADQAAEPCECQQIDEADRLAGSA